MSKIEEITLIIFKELLSRNIHGMSKDRIKEIYQQAIELAEYATKQ